MSKISIRQTLLAAGAAALVGIPLIAGYVHTYPKLSGLSAFLGLVMALMTNPKVVFLVSTLMNLFFPDTPVSPVVTAPTPQQKDGGFIALSRMAFLMLVVSAFMFAMLVPRMVHAQPATQKYGGCLTPGSYGQVCVGPRAGVLITRYDFSGPLSGKFTGGFQPGAGYGIMLQSSDPMQNWKMLEFDVFGSAAIGGSASTIPSNFSLTGLFTFFNYVSVGGGTQWTEQATGSAKAGFFITGGLTLNPGGTTPAQAKAHEEQMKRAAEQDAATPHN